jgi:hypothetical protein
VQFRFDGVDEGQHIVDDGLFAVGQLSVHVVDSHFGVGIDFGGDTFT